MRRVRVKGCLKAALLAEGHQTPVPVFRGKNCRRQESQVCAAEFRDIFQKESLLRTAFAAEANVDGINIGRRRRDEATHEKRLN